jgi:hypothetical protein
MPTIKPKPKSKPQAEDIPASYRAEYAEQGRKLCLLLGATDQELARFFNVSTATLDEWLARVPDFATAIRAGKDLADADVADRLHRRAVGYSHEAVRVFSDRNVSYVENYPPDTAACIFWLKSRQPDRWRDKIEHEHHAVAEMLEALDAAGERAKNARRG